MRIPFWQRDEAHPTRAIDRVQHQRASRKVVGLEVADDFSRIDAAMLLVKGVGKYVRAKLLQWESHEIDSTAQTVLKEISAADERSDSDYRFASAELGFFQSECLKTLILKNGSAKADVVAAGVRDPGAWTEDFEGRRTWRSLTDANRLAHQTSLTIIDRFAERDIADGGNGAPLLPLAYWFLLADRNEKIAEQNRVLILSSDHKLEVIGLPASDGLDSVLPEIKYFCSDAKSVGNQASLIKQQVSEIGFSIHQVITNSKDSLVDFFEEPVSIAELSQSGFPDDSINASATALLANSFIDQLPMSIPELTGNHAPRVLGCLTPGSLANFRRFVLETAKVTPTIMKLRDAI